MAHKPVESELKNFYVISSIAIDYAADLPRGNLGYKISQIWENK